MNLAVMSGGVRPLNACGKLLNRRRTFLLVVFYIERPQFMHHKHFCSAFALSGVTLLISGLPALVQADDSTQVNPPRRIAANDRSEDPEQQSKGETTPDKETPSGVDAKHHALLGVSLQDRDDRLRVIAVLPGSPAARAGVRVGDEIASADGERVHTSQQLIDIIAEKQPGAEVPLGIRRDGDRQTVRAKLVSLDTFQRQGASADRDRRGRSDPRRSASYDPAAATAGDSGNSAAQNRRIWQLEHQVSQLKAQVNDLTANRRRNWTSFQGNGDNGWYDESQPGDRNQGINDYGARARDGQ